MMKNLVILIKLIGLKIITLTIIGTIIFIIAHGKIIITITMVFMDLVGRICIMAGDFQVTTDGDIHHTMAGVIHPTTAGVIHLITAGVIHHITAGVIHPTSVGDIILMLVTSYII